MNWLDIVLIVAVAASAVTSFRKGFSREVIGLAAVVLALLLGIWFYGTAGSFLEPYVSSSWIAHFAGFFIVFGAVVILGSLVSYVVGRFLRVTGLSMVDHLLGALFGLARGLVVATAIVMGLMAFSPIDHPPAAVVQSRVAPYMVDAARLVSAVAPHELKEGFRRTYGQVKDAWGKAFDKDGRDLPAAEGKDERKI